MVKEKLMLKHINKKFLITVIALLEAALLIAAGTFSWIEGSKNGSADGDNCIVSAGSGLVFTGDNISNGKLNLSFNGKMEDCSSTDGRNFFFPTAGSLHAAQTSDMVFRKGTDADKNTKYVSVDFQISTLETSGVGSTPIYIDNTSSVTCTGNSLKPFRISLNFNDGTPPVVLCPGVNKTGYYQTTNAVSSIDDNGKAALVPVQSNSMASYWYSSANPVVRIQNGESKNVTMTIWLEGTDSACTNSNVALKDLNVDIKLTTAANYTKEVTFVDYSPNQWVKDKPESGNDVFMFAIDKSTFTGTNYSDGVAYLMTRQSDNITYKTSLPETVTDVVFARYDPDDETLGYNVWASASGDSMTSSSIHTYYAVGLGKSVDGTNYGYWVNSNCTGVLDIYFTDIGNVMRANTMNPNMYQFGSQYGKKNAGGKNELKPWAGFYMSSAGTNSNGENVYHMIVPADTEGIVFNGNGNQTVDILLNDYKNKTGITKIGFYLDGKSEEKYSVKSWIPDDTWPRV